MTKRAVSYEAVVACKREWQPGDILDPAELPADVLTNWLEIGVLRPYDPLAAIPDEVEVETAVNRDGEKVPAVPAVRQG